MGLCEDQEYFYKEHLDDLRENAQDVARLLNGYIRYLRKQLTHTSEGFINKNESTS